MHERNRVRHERTILKDIAEQFKTKMEGYVHDPDLHELITALAEEREVTIPEIDGAALDEETFMTAAQTALDFRKGKGRDAIKNTTLSPRTREALEVVEHNFGMTVDTEPTTPQADAVFVLGSSGKTPRKRLDYALELIEAGALQTDTLVLIGSERPVDIRQNAAGLNEIDRAESAGYDKSGNVAKTEFDIMRNSAAAALDIPDEAWEYVKGYEPQVPEHHHYQDNYTVAYTKAGNKNILVVSAPMLSEERIYPDGNRRPRSNTLDGYRMVARMMRDTTNEEEPLHTVSITDAIFTRFQEADAQSTLAEFGITNETVGFTRKHAGLPEWPGGDALYAQEILSALRQTRAARDYLNQ